MEKSYSCDLKFERVTITHTVFSKISFGSILHFENINIGIFERGGGQDLSLDVKIFTLTPGSSQKLIESFSPSLFMVHGENWPGIDKFLVICRGMASQQLYSAAESDVQTIIPSHPRHFRRIVHPQPKPNQFVPFIFGHVCRYFFK
jgi:hypothetical protein